MKRIAFAVIVAVLAFGVAILAKTQTQIVEQELIKLENGWLEAILKKDVAFLDQILADDITETDSEGNIITKAQDLEEIKSGVYVVTSAVFDEIKVRVYGDAAVVTGRTTGKGQYKGKNFSGQRRWTDTWAKLSGRWQCVATHSSDIPQK